jgi:dihydrodipicolinate synthase/N-acetylneuraminate lyase
MEAARAAQFKANKLIEVILKFGVVCSVKEMLQMIGYDCGYQVYPQKRFTEEERKAFQDALKAIRYEEEYL